MSWDVKLENEKMLKERDVLLLSRFFSVLNYFWAVYFVIWLRKTHVNGNKVNPTSETALHVFVYLVYIIEIFNPPVTTYVCVSIYLVFAPIVFAYHVCICRHFLDVLGNNNNNKGYFLLLKHKKVKNTTINAIISVTFIWIFCVSIAAVTVKMIAEILQISVGEVFAEYHLWSLTDYFSNILKVSFISLITEAYSHLAFRNLRARGRLLQQQQEETTTPSSCSAYVTRLSFSLLLFTAMVFLSIFPKSLTFIMELDDVAEKVLNTTAIIFLQIIFIIDSAGYALEYHARRLFTTRRRRVERGQKRHAVGQITNETVMQF